MTPYTPYSAGPSFRARVADTTYAETNNTLRPTTAAAFHAAAVVRVVGGRCAARGPRVASTCRATTTLARTPRGHVKCPDGVDIRRDASARRRWAARRRSTSTHASAIWPGVTPSRRVAARWLAPAGADSARSEIPCRRVGSPCAAGAPSYDRAPEKNPIARLEYARTTCHWLVPVAIGFGVSLPMVSASSRRRLPRCEAELDAARRRTASVPVRPASAARPILVGPVGHADGANLPRRQVPVEQVYQRFDSASRVVVVKQVEIDVVRAQGLERPLEVAGNLASGSGRAPNQGRDDRLLR